MDLTKAFCPSEGVNLRAKGDIGLVIEETEVGWAVCGLDVYFLT